VGLYKRAKAKLTVEAIMQEHRRTVPLAIFNQAGNTSVLSDTSVHHIQLRRDARTWIERHRVLDAVLQ
jgi:hypothetical protein